MRRRVIRNKVKLFFAERVLLAAATSEACENNCSRCRAMALLLKKVM